MVNRLIERQLRDGEEVIRVVRRSWVAFLGPILVAALFSLAPFFFLIPLFRLGPLGMIAFVASLAIGLTTAIRTWLVASKTTFVLTAERIIDIDQQGFFARSISETRYEQIQDVSLRVKGLLQTFAKIGDVVVETGSGRSNLVIRDVREPEKIQGLLVRLQTDRLTSPNRSSAP